VSSLIPKNNTNNDTTSDKGGFPILEFDDVLALVPETICMDRVPGQGWTTICTPKDTIEQGGGSCNLVARAFLDQVPSADVAIQNAGACRNDIGAGNFTYNDAFVLLPFVNRLMTLEMSGDQIVLLLVHALNHVMVNNSTGGYPYCAGLRYDVNLTAPFLSRISNIEVNKQFASDAWGPIELDANFTVLANSYIVTDEDSYFALMEEALDELATDNGKDATETFAGYANEQGVLLDPPRSEY
jgi:5'-nucleotidase